MYVGPHHRFEKIWIEQCRATLAIERRFEVKDALDYLVGEKLRTFAGAAGTTLSAKRTAAFWVTDPNGAVARF